MTGSTVPEARGNDQQRYRWHDSYAEKYMHNLNPKIAIGQNKVPMNLLEDELQLSSYIIHVVVHLQKDIVFSSK